MVKVLLSWMAIFLMLASNPSLAVTDSQENALEKPSKKSIVFFKRQVKSNNSVENAVKSLIARYPEKASNFVKVALFTYPEKYEEIIRASVIAKPVIVDEIIKLANHYKVSAPTNIVAIAVNAEPSYAEVATKAACKYSPEDFTEIVRTAVKSEPDSADQIAQKLVTAYPNRALEILVTTIKEVPYVGKYVLDALLALVQEDKDTTEDMIVASIEQLADYPSAMERLVKLAKEHKIDANKVSTSAIKGGLDEESVASLIKTHY
ncbi:hypothetical protein [Agaribacter flavus]|uniref:HEAT repeat domain-containing protein n=1 Tax=Agaribacter flavus TaxID=1902781 RepID=A0ABV7FUF6_9ALTE